MRYLSYITISLSFLLLSACASDVSKTDAVYELPESTKPVPASMKQRVAVRLELAKRYISLKQFDLANTLLDEILKEQDDNIDALHLKAISLMGAQNYAEADIYFQKTLAKTNNPDILNNYGWFLCKQANANGLTYLAKVEPIANAILYPKVLANQSVCYMYQKDYKKATELLQKSLELNPNYVPANVYLAYIYAKQNNTLGAENLLNKLGLPNVSEPELLWLGINVFKLSGNTISVKLWGNYLVSEFPNSQEVIKYHRNLVE
ncbi:MAG: type pilus biosis/stability protein PilW [Pseudomonadota bacterium]|jgi:type IV pilus assembly protein PilF